MQIIPKEERLRDRGLPVYDRALLLNGSKRNEVLSLAEIEQYGLDGFADPDYISIYGMSPQEWYGCGIRLLGRTAVECTRDALGDRIGRDVASVARRMPSDHLVVIDPFSQGSRPEYRAAAEEMGAILCREKLKQRNKGNDHD